MRLELGKIFIKDIQFGDVTEVKDGVLFINKQEMLQEIGGDEHIKSIDIELARPGESVRITPVKDVIEPRVKVEGNGGIFPGIMSKVDTVGEENSCFKRCSCCNYWKNSRFPRRYNRHDWRRS